jgi:putative membrane protein
MTTQTDPILQPAIKKNDPKAKLLIGVVSFVVFAAVVILSKVKLEADLGFNVHVFAGVNAVINSMVSVLLIWGLISVRKKKYLLHKRVMIFAMLLSILFLVSYITHHLLSGDTVYGDADHNGLLDEAERAVVGGTRMIYLIVLATHIFLAAIILPFILFTAYRGLTSEFPRHKKLAKITWPIWLYVSLTGPVVYLLISPFYS